MEKAKNRKPAAAWYRVLQAQAPLWWLKHRLELPLLAWLAGLLCYWSLPAEPSLSYPMYSAIFLCLLVFILRRHPRVAFIRILCLLAGVFVGAIGYAGWWVQQQATVPIAETYENHAITAVVDRVEERQRGRLRLTLREVCCDRQGQVFSGRMRISVGRRVGADVWPEDAVSMQVNLYPLMPPVIAGGFDMARHGWLQGVVGSGYARGAVHILPGEQEEPPTTLQNVRQRWRELLAQAMQRHMTENTADIARALVLGERGQIAQSLEEAYRQSGLTHILSISGLHMALVALLFYGGLRRILCLWPGLALRIPTHKLAAMLAWGGSGLYLWLAEAPVSAQRAWLMAACVGLAVIWERPVTGLRLLALAGWVVTLIHPPQVLGAGFQLSFLAVLALLVAYRPAFTLPVDASLPLMLRHLYRQWDASKSLLRASVWVLVLTAPVVGWHFREIGWVGVFSNVIAIPLASLWVMPSLLLASLFQPVGMAMPFLWLAEQGIALLNHISAYVGALVSPYPLVFPAMQGWAVMLLVYAMILAAWLHGRYAWFLPVFALMVVAVWGRAEQPLLLAEASQMAWRDSIGWHVLPLSESGGRQRHGNHFMRTLWQGRLNMHQREWHKHEMQESRFCDGAACAWHVAGQWVEVPRTPESLPELCHHADSILLPEGAEALNHCLAKLWKLTPPARGYTPVFALYPNGRWWRSDAVTGSRPWYVGFKRG